MIAQLGRGHIDYLYVQVSHMAEVPLDLTQWTSLWFKVCCELISPVKQYKTGGDLNS
jgi:hypothetical protein